MAKFTYEQLVEQLKVIQEFLKSAYKDQWEAFIALDDHTESECPTYYDGCHCSVMVLRHNIERAERAEKALELQMSTHDQGHSPCYCIESKQVLEDRSKP